MSERVVVDPITRIEGHLRIEAQTEGGKITQYERPKYFCKTCMAESEKEKELCKPKKSKRA